MDVTVDVANRTLPAGVQALADERERLADLQADLRGLVEEFDERDDVQSLRSGIAAAIQSVQELEASVRLLACRIFDTTLDAQPHPAVAVRTYDVLGYDEPSAVRFAVEHKLFGALTVKRRDFEKAARAVLSVTPGQAADGITMTTEHKALIATDINGAIERAAAK